jgi:hypothetical protein
MRPENETSEPELIAKAFQEISKQIIRGGLAKARLKPALGYSGAVQGAVSLSQGGELLAKADAGFPRERVKYFVSQPSARELRLPVEPTRKTFTRICISVISMLGPQATISFESAQLFEAIRKTNMSMIGGQQTGRMGGYRCNTRTLLSRGSSQCSRIFDFGLNLNSVPFEAFRHGGRIWVKENTMRGTVLTFARPLRQSVQMPGSC